MFQSLITQIMLKIGSHFDSLILDFLGFIPKSNNRKRLSFDLSKENIISIFLQNLGTDSPNKEEETVLKNRISISNSYLESLKNKTQAKVLNDLTTYFFEAKIGKEEINGLKVMEIVKDNIDKNTNQFKMIIGAESHAAANLASAMQIAKVGETRGEKDPSVYFSVIRDERNDPETLRLHLLPDGITPRVWKLSELNTGYHIRNGDRPSVLGTNPNCFLGKSGVNILTEERGYVNISEVKIGERVLTHTGKFKRVIGNLDLHKKKYYKDFYILKFKNKGRDGNKIQSLRITPDHMFLTQRGWVEAKDLNNADKLMNLKNKCSFCDNSCDTKPKRNKNSKFQEEDFYHQYFCSDACKMSYYWSKNDYRENIKKKNSDFMNIFSKNNSEAMKERGKTLSLYTKKLQERGEFWAQKEESKNILRKNIAKTNSILQKNRTSKEELLFLKLIKNIYPNVEHQKIVGHFCVDFTLEDLKIIIEYDGGGHYLPVYTKKMTMQQFLGVQKGRDVYLNKMGYHVVRYSEIPTEEKFKEDMLRISSNSKEKYFFEELEVISIDFKKNQKTGFKLYDLTVEDDESFVVNGIVSHNCRCRLVYIPKSYGFNSKGQIVWKALDWNELEYQRKNFEMPQVIEKTKKTKKSKQTVEE